MPWWEGKDCVSTDCIPAAYYNGVLDKGEEAWDCVFGTDTGGPFATVPRVKASDSICAAHITLVRGYINQMYDECGECGWSDLGEPCKDSQDPESGDKCCFCDYYCLDTALDCILENCCGQCYSEFKIEYNCLTGVAGAMTYSTICSTETKTTGQWLYLSKPAEDKCTVVWYEKCDRACESDSNCLKKCIDIWEVTYIKATGTFSSVTCAGVVCDYVEDHPNLDDGWFKHEIDGSGNCVLRAEISGSECINSSDHCTSPCSSSAPALPSAADARSVCEIGCPSGDPSVRLTVTGPSGTINWCGETWNLPGDSGVEKSVCPTKYTRVNNMGPSSSRWNATHSWNFNTINGLDLRIMYTLRTNAVPPIFRRISFQIGGGANIKSVFLKGLSVLAGGFWKGSGSARPIPVSLVSTPTWTTLFSTMDQTFSSYDIGDDMFGSYTVGGITYSHARGFDWP
jgi:hypothetical protein